MIETRSSSYVNRQPHPANNSKTASLATRNSPKLQKCSTASSATTPTAKPASKKQDSSSKSRPSTLACPPQHAASNTCLTPTANEVKSAFCAITNSTSTKFCAVASSKSTLKTKHSTTSKNSQTSTKMTWTRRGWSRRSD